MESKRTNAKLLAAGTIAALGASLCCITPVLALVAGLGGAASAFSWLDPFRPYLIGLTLLVLGFAWYQKLKPKKETLACACEAEEKKPFVQSKTFLGAATALALLLLSFPYYSNAFFPEPVTKAVAKQAQLQQVQLEIKGMTCRGCESSVNHALSSKEGVVKASASYRAGMASVTYDPTLVTPEVLKKAIEEEVGYKVTTIEEVATKHE
jgi:mercuric ion transport protein